LTPLNHYSVDSAYFFPQRRCILLMPIQFTCPSCGQQTSVDDAYAGQSGPCASCGQTVTIPGKPTAVDAPKKSSGISGPMIAVIVGVSLAALCCLCAVPALLLPAVQESARATACTINMRQITLAIQNYHDIYQAMPTAIVADESGRPLHSWRVLILPFIEQNRLYDQIRFDEPWDSDHNSQFANQCPHPYRCPSDPSNPSDCNYRVVMGKNNPWRTNDSVSIQNITDGTSNTIAVVEVADFQSNWMEPKELQMDSIPMAVNSPSGGIGSHHPSSAFVGMFDGSVHRLTNNIDPETLKHLLEHSDGQVIDEF